MIVASIEYFDKDLELYPDGSVHDATLALDVSIQGLPCAGERSVVYYRDGRLRLAWLRWPTIINDVGCRAEIVYLHPNGRPANVSLLGDHRFDGVVVSDRKRVTLDAAGGLIEYSSSVEKDRHVHGLPCARGYDLWRYADESPSSVVLAASADIASTTYSRGDHLTLSRHGKVLDVEHYDLDGELQYKQPVFGAIKLNLT